MTAMPKQKTGLPAIPIGELRAVVNLILDHIIHDLKIENVQLDEDYYWGMGKEDLYAILNEKPDLTIGSLADDWDFLSKMDKDRRHEAVSLMLIHVAPLLRYVGEKVGQ
jgi:hypothetical protein